MRWSQRHGPRRRDSEETPDVWCGCSLRGSVAQRHRLRTVTDQQPHQEGVVRPPSGPATAHGVSSSKTGSHTAEKVLDTASNATSQDFCKRLSLMIVCSHQAPPRQRGRRNGMEHHAYSGIFPSVSQSKSVYEGVGTCYGAALVKAEWA